MPLDSSDLPPDEARAFLHGLFSGGLRDPELLAELCPEGWEKSPLFASFHPPPAMAYREYLAQRESMRELPFEGPELGFDEFCETEAEEWGKCGGIDPVEEPAELLGLCLWDVFSDGHEVLAADGRVADLGSFRGTAGEIAGFFEETAAPGQEDGTNDAGESEDAKDWDWHDGEDRGRSDYMRFYMGTIWVAGRADLTPVYRLIFRRITAAGGDWRYSFPRLRLFSPGEIAEHAGLPYDPSAAVADELEQAGREEETRRMREKLDRANLAAQREARGKAPPETVRAYQEIFGRFPAGWPPDPYRLE